MLRLCTLGSERQWAVVSGCESALSLALPIGDHCTKRFALGSVTVRLRYFMVQCVATKLSRQQRPNPHDNQHEIARLRERDVLEVCSQDRESRCLGHRNANPTRTRARFSGRKQSKWGRRLASVLQGGATEMRSQHRPQGETVSGQSAGFPRHMNGERNSTMRPREQPLTLRVRCSWLTRKGRRCCVPRRVWQTLLPTISQSTRVKLISTGGCRPRTDCGMHCRLRVERRTLASC